MIISVTEREEFKRCRRRWDYSSYNRQNLQPITPGASLSLGTLIHKSLADWAAQCYLKDTGERLNLTVEGFTPPSLQQIFMHNANQAVDEAKANYCKNIGSQPSDSELASLYEAVDLGHAMMGNYETQWKWPFPIGWTLYSLEQEYIIKVPGTDHYLKGKLDGVIVAPDRKLWIVEHKTYSMRPRPQILDNNNQFLAYIWLLKQWAPNETIGGIAYDGMWKKAKPSKGEPLESLFCHMLLTRSQYELNEFEQHLYLEVNDIANCPQSVYYNRRWEGCYDCPYESLCTAQSKGDDVEFALTHYTKRQVETNGDD